MNRLEKDLEEISFYENIDWVKNCQNKTFFVTGGTGLVGSFVIKTLVYVARKQNIPIHIIALVRSKEKALRVLDGYLDYVSFIEGSLLGKISVDQNVDYIIHGASVTASKEMVTNPVGTIDTAIFGSKNVLELAVEKNVKSMVYISSMEAYGSVEYQEQRITEVDYGYVDPIKVRSCYPEGKRMVENMCVAYATQYDLPVKIARLAQTFGAGVSPEENRVFAQFAKSLINEENIVLHTQGESWGNYCYTKDCIIALFTILFDGANAEAYNVVNENTSMTIKSMAELIIKMSKGKCELIFDIPESNDFGYAPATGMKLSSQKLNELGWEATVDLEEMYERLIASWV